VTATAMKKRQGAAPVFCRRKEMMDPESGELVPCMVPASRTERLALDAKRVPDDAVLRVDICVPRNWKFFRKAHALAKLVAFHVEGYERFRTDSHGMLKHLQVEAGVECDVTVSDVPGIGRMQFTKARSMAFEEMEEEAFDRVYRAICQYVIDAHWPGFSVEQLAEMSGFVGDER
jgi:hypothetical protein